MTFGGRSPNVRSLEQGIFIHPDLVLAPSDFWKLIAEIVTYELRLDPQQTATAIKRHINKQRKVHPNSLVSCGLDCTLRHSQKDPCRKSHGGAVLPY